MVFMIGFSAGLGPAPWCLAAELSPLRGKGFEFGSVCAFHWASALAITSMFSILGTTTTRLALLILLSSAFSFAGGVIAFNRLPDTRRVSLEFILVSGQGQRSRRPSETRHSAGSRASPAAQGVSRKDSTRGEQKE
ncbi:hypothetical protein V5799_028055 [Amblyomma americanum]|uniref:Uncharacterized protein n=1 Tax=Amblyomma americanum TaxID=6943 RepID=A0AAQ4DDY8_AMBAM